MSKMPNWTELEEQFGLDNIKVIDQAVGVHLSDSTEHGSISRDEVYLVSEGLTFSILLAMREAGIRFSGAVRTLR